MLGDDTHGAEVSRRFEPRPPRLALHAGVLGFRHPATDEPVRWVSPPPPELATWIDRLRGVAPPSPPSEPPPSPADVP